MARIIGLRSSSVRRVTPGRARGRRRRAVVVDAELAHARALCLELDALHAPERGHGVHPLREQRLDGLEPDRDVPDRAGSPPAPARPTQHRVVGGQAGDADPPALEVARRADARARDHRRERLLHERHHAHDVGARSRASPRSWMSRIAASARPDCSSLSASVDAPGAGRQLDALRLVVAALVGQVDAGVHGVGLEVQQQRRLLARAIGAGIRPAAGQQREQQEQDQRAAHRARRVGERE